MKVKKLVKGLGTFSFVEQHLYYIIMMEAKSQLREANIMIGLHWANELDEETKTKMSQA